jgi:hypothetical protein
MKIQLMECDGCKNYFSDNQLKHYDMCEFGEATYCEECAVKADAAYENAEWEVI